MGKEIIDYQRGCEIAKQITSVMREEELESDVLKKWIADDPHSQELVSRLSSATELERMCADFVREERDEELIAFVQRLSQRKKRIRRFRLRMVAGLSSAAAILAISFLLYNQSITTDSSQNASKIHSWSISADQRDQSKPTLILDDGQSIDLTSAGSEITNSDLTILKNNDTQLSYLKAERLTGSKKTLYNTLVVPKMYSYNVQLEDGTVVYLNANSELKYPTHFDGNVREVFLEGEGYFEVKKSDKPFIVTVSDVQVRVYGTKFNINSSEPPFVKTTLVSGSVGVTIPNRKEVVICPNEMIVSSTTMDSNEVLKVDSNRYIAWVGGYFRYDDDKLSDMLQELSVWYGVSFILEDSRKKDFPVTASYSRSTSLEEIISSISDATKLNFIKKGEHYFIK